MSKARNGIWLYDNERKGKWYREKWFYDNLQLFKHCFNQSFTHTQPTIAKLLQRIDRICQKWCASYFTKTMTLIFNT